MNKTSNKNYEWIIHILVWIGLFALPSAFFISSGRPFKDLFLHFWTQLIAIATLFYVNYFVLVKHWMYQNKKWPFIILNIALLVFFVWGRDFLIDNFSSPPDGGKVRRKPPIGFRFYIDFLVYLIPIAFAFAIQSAKRALHIEAIKKEADNIKLQSELQHLKFQLQPHFFFNALNNIYSSIDLDPNQAKTAIHSLSKLMRYFLQKSEEEAVSLSDEIDFLTRYINLMKMRLTAKTTVEVAFPEVLPNVKMPPLILISLVENAFKHGVSATENSKIQFELNFDGNDIHFTTVNSNFPKRDDDKSGSGIGLSNLRKRLQILYPNHHQFETQLEDKQFHVRLSIPVQQEN